MDKNTKFITIVAGSRSTTHVQDTKDGMNSCPWTISAVVSGLANGPDTIAKMLAEVKGVPVHQFKPDWSLGRHAGFLRNKDMGDFAEALCAIWDGESKGTKQMIEYMEKLGKPVHIHRVESDAARTKRIELEIKRASAGSLFDE